MWVIEVLFTMVEDCGNMMSDGSGEFASVVLPAGVNPTMEQLLHNTVIGVV